MQADLRDESFPIPTGPATRAILSLLDTLDAVSTDASPDTILFPDICPQSDTIRGAAMSVERANYLLRRFVFVPAGILGGERLTLRSIRSGASTDAAASGVATEDRLAQGGWELVAGAKPYLDRSIIKLTGQAPSAL
jgi:hypothetical protein